MLSLLLAWALAEQPEGAPSTVHGGPCTSCHAEPPEWTGVVGDAAICLACHTDSPHAGARGHLGPLPEAMRPRLEEAGLPLAAEGRVVCLTCHDPHPPGSTERSAERGIWAGERFVPEAWQVRVLEPTRRERGEPEARSVTHEIGLTRLRLDEGELCAACHSLEDMDTEPALRSP
jgi:hypothetical protein